MVFYLGDSSVTLNFGLIEIDFGEGTNVSLHLCPLENVNVLECTSYA